MRNAASAEDSGHCRCAGSAAAAGSGARPPNKGDTAWMLVSTLLVIMMTIPGLALFYGGLVRTKNMLSVLTQVFVIFCADLDPVGGVRLLRWPSPPAAAQQLHRRLRQAVPEGRDRRIDGRRPSARAW
ncbi:MAG: hypothetical protein MZV65_54280 [Chromatiales bacterium]|nr:hypothetical protein [Chromatiales bacterium]